MTDRKLFSFVEDGEKYIQLNVLWQWISLLAECAFVYAAALTMDALYSGLSGGVLGIFAVMTATGAILVRYMCTRAQSRCIDLSSCAAKEDLQEMIFAKCNDERISEEARTALKNVDPFAQYYSEYVPQYRYAVVAPVTLFIVLYLISWKAALVLLGFAALLYALIRRNQKQPLRPACMELAAYIGAAFGMITALLELKNHSIQIYGCMMIILLSLEFFLPMLKVGKEARIYKEGTAASDQISAYLGSEEDGREGDGE